MLVLETKDLTKKYKNQVVVNNVNMHVHEGDIYGFVGENGAGKTTIIRLVSGLIKPNSGSYSLFETNYKDKKIFEARKKVSGIVESVSINRSMDALANLKLQCYVTNTKKSDEELIELLNEVGLDYKEIQKKRSGNFSLGMRQRLGLAMAMVSNPSFILLDEPMNGLDPKGFIDFREAVERLHQKGVTFLISSHILSELDKICTRIGFISRGVLLDEIEINDLRHKARRKIMVDSDDISSLAESLIKDLKIKESNIDGKKLFIYDDMDINIVINYLVKKDIKVNNVGVIQDTIEDYYLSLMRKTIQ